MKRSWSSVLGASLLSIVALNFTARGVPMVDFFCPPVQQTPPLVGKLTGVDDPTKYKLLVLVSGNLTIWNDKTHLMPSGNYAQGGEGLPIAADGSFSAANWQSIPLNTWELTTPYLGIWVVPTTFDARWAQPNGTPIYQVEGTAIPQKVYDAAICYVIKTRKNEVAKRWPEVSAVRPIQQGSKNASVNLKNTPNQAPANLYTVTGKKVLNANQNRSSAGRGIYVAPAQKNSARPTQRVNTVSGNN
jgi:hypothetical protein